MNDLASLSLPSSCHITFLPCSLQVHLLIDNSSKAFPLYQITNFQINVYKQNSNALFMSSFIHLMTSLHHVAHLQSSRGATTAQLGEKCMCICICAFCRFLLRAFVQLIPWIIWPYHSTSAKAHKMDSLTPIFPFFIEACINLSEST